MLTRYFFLLLATLMTTLAHAQNTPMKPAHPSLPGAAVPDGLGVNIHFTEAKPGEMKMLAEGGFKWVRMDLGWAHTERELGKYDFSSFDRLLKSLDEHKIRALLILDYGNRLYNPGGSTHPDTDAAHTPEFRRGYANWAAAAAKHFAGRGIIWEVWNEPNHSGFWKPQPNVADYSALALEACKAIRQVAPNECIIGPATSTIDMAFLEGTFKAGLLHWWDAVSVHPYRQNAPETASEELRKLRELIEKYKPAGKTIPIISGEWGYSSAWNGHDEISQGKMLPRQWLTNLMNDVPLSIWYDWHNDGEDAKEAEHNFGTVGHKYFEGRNPIYDPKPAYLAARAFTSTLRGFGFNKRLWTGDPNDYLMLFSKGDEVRLAAWTTGRGPYRISIPASAGAFRVINHLGEAMSPLDANGDTLEIEVSDSVRYVVPEKTNDLLRIAAAWERAPKEIVVRGPATVQQTLKLNRISDRPKGRIFTVGHRQPVMRSSLAAPLNFFLTAGDSAFWQQTPVIVTNPLIITAMPRMGDRLPVRIENPSGEAFAGRIQGLQASAPRSAPLTLQTGETEKIVLLPWPALTQDGIMLRVQTRAGQTALQTDRMKFIAVDNFARAGIASDYVTTADGDAKVLSTQSVSAAIAPSKLFGEDVPALKLDYKWDAGWKFVQVRPKIDALKNILNRPQALQMWVHGDGSGNHARLRFTDETGQTFQPNGAPISWTGWKLVTFALDGSNAGFWGGRNDGIIQGKIHFDTLFLLDSANRTVGQGTVYLAAPTLVYNVHGVK